MSSSVRDLAAQLQALGVDHGGVLLVHMSYRAVRPVEGGPEGVIDALLAAVGETGTVVMPSWTDNDDAVFDPSVSPANSDLGITASLFWRRPGVQRGNHPFAFAALGPKAAAITADPLPLPPHRLESAVGRVFELGGQVLLLGVGHDSNTTIHLAEALAGVPYGVPKHITVLQDGEPARIDYLENDHCCQRFAFADEWLRERGLQREGTVGNAQARLLRSRDIVEVVGERLRADSLVFLHRAGSGCVECDVARKSIGHAEA
jgi:aminoglycoside N3'-acetyltransferase